MSRKLIVAVFDEQNSAYTTIKAIKEAKAKNIIDFELYTGQMLSKDEKGNLNIVENQDRDLIGTGGGMALGALIGIFGGLPAAAAGAMIGTLTGMTFDIIGSSADQNFVLNLVKDIEPGQVLVAIEAKEGNTEFIDNLVAQNNGTVQRTILNYE